ncbi:MAG: hypothetical protein P8130_12065 [Deltaproteobacteria bacterium]
MGLDFGGYHGVLLRGFLLTVDVNGDLSAGAGPLLQVGGMYAGLAGQVYLVVGRRCTAPLKNQGCCPTP